MEELKGMKLPIIWQKGSEYPFMGPELACGISERGAKWAMRNLIDRKHQELLQELPAKRTRELLRLKRNG
jgi:hypothetical protein